jgi:glycosyltransferase involved in cell wall biosynthesis
MRDGSIEGLRVRILPARSSKHLHWSLQALGKARMARRQLTDLGQDHDLFISCQPEAVSAYSGQDRRQPALYVCGGTTLLHEEAERADQARLSVYRRLAFGIDRAMKRRVERAAFRAADAVVFDSLTTRERVVTDYVIEPAKCHVVHGGVDPSHFTVPTAAERVMSRRGLGIPDGSPVIAWTGRLSPEKNVELLIRAVASCRGTRPILVLVGDGSCRDSLSRIAVDLGCENRVMFIGRVLDVRPYLHAADVFAFPSRGESFGGALAEAMACGLPCLGLRPDGRRVRSANEEILEHGRSGRLIDQHDPPAFACALDELLADEPLRHRIGRAARQRVESRFTWDIGGGQLLNVITALKCSERGAHMSPNWADRGLSCVLPST